MPQLFKKRNAPMAKSGGFVIPTFDRQGTWEISKKILAGGSVRHRA
jgi:hypothetical protein